MIQVLVVDDSALMRKLLTGIFSAAGDFAVSVARDGVDALKQIAVRRPDVITLDIHMPGLDGLDCLKRIMSENPCPVVMVSALTEEGAEETLAALDAGAVDFVAKPDGAISLRIDDMSADLVAKVRAAAGVRMPGRRRSEAIAEATSPVAMISSTAEHLSNGADGLVLIGTSTGGPTALEAVLSSLPGDLRWPVVIAQHMPASFTGPLARRLDRLSALTVVEVTSPTMLQSGHAYIGKGEADVIITRRGDRLHVTAAPMQADYLWHPSADRLVRSALQHVEADRILGVLMTGMGSDGAAAMTDLRKAGGHTIAEAQETAVVWGMPGELVRRNGAVETVPLDAIARRVGELLT
ncbi:MAG: chemotaxis-specific protein-glutamate methyltransferase CheB [Candidatus Devosia phytovorans]|uniref:Protein-glutamate methylesterase/protein-glutamine glutaminase n=1 Tax=Candidatus Devosia phytovorans TaxID=3121372 RepID=A0AAJ5VVK6_9HYPH|nr:chemotaxis-specific protein-glutamate methyltransferase CheB [Devosia sp.]WEK04352.1 MAG: chemotaxis-specific protein-glutamate methyltransferase CheB [Devosia sp.]